MKRHAKASSAGSTSGIGNSRGLFGRAFATRGASAGYSGTGAPSSRPRRLALSIVLGLVFAMVSSAGPAGAAKVRPLKETFGSATHPSFAKPLSLAVDQSVSPSPTAGDLLVIDAGANEKQLVEVIAEAGFYKLSFSGQTTGWSGTGTITCNGTSTSITGVTTSTGALVAREAIRSTPGSCIKPNTTIVSFNAGAGTITLSQATENIPANSGVRSLASDLTIKSATAALTAAQISSQIREALEKLPNVGVGNIGVSGTGTTSPFKREVEFKGALAETDVAPLTCDGSGLTAPSPSCSVVPGLSTAVRYGIKRFNPDGTPANFSALGTNIIDGRKGAGGNTCGGEASSCDETPQNSLIFAPAGEMQVAIDNSGGPTNGDIYLTQAAALLIDVFASDGHYLGQLTKYKEGPLGEGAEKAFGEVCGVAVDPTGNLYIGDFGVAGTPFSGGVVHKFSLQGVPHSPLATSDNTANFASPRPCSVAAGTGPTAGFIFPKQMSNAIRKLDSTTGVEKYTVASGANTTVAVNPADGHVLAASGSVVTEYDASGPTEATLTSTLTAANTVQGVAVNKTTGNVYISRVGNLNLEVYGPPADAPIVIANAASGVTGTTATLNGTVNPEFGAIEECKFEYLTATAYEAAGNSFNGTGANAPATAPCAGSIPIDSSPHAVSAVVGGLIPQGTTYYFRLTAKNLVAKVSSTQKTFVTVETAITEAATAVAATTATLNGTLRIEEEDPFTACVFEYLTDAAYAGNGNSYSGPNTPLTKPCTPAIEAIASDFQPHSVSAALTGLAQNTTYHFRLVATHTAGTVRGQDQSFSTPGPPQVIGQSAGALRTGAELLARVNPSGFATTYRFEWGTDSSYGNRIPADFDLFAGSGTSPVNLTANISGLQEMTTYHFHVLATNSAGTTAGPDQEFTTLNSAGLPDGRRFELVSPPDKRPQGVVKAQNGATFVTYQVAEDGQSSLFPILNGLEDTDSGGDTSYLATRHESSWQSTKISPPSLVPPPQTGGLGSASAGRVVYNSPDLSCGVINTFNPITADTPAADVELGVVNLYRRNPDGSHTLITSTVPANPGIPSENAGSGTPFVVGGASKDCSRIYFQSEYQYLPNPSGLYEWDKGTLRDAGRLPNGATPVGNLSLSTTKPAVFGGEWGANGASGSRVNSVSRDGSRFFFTALSNAGGDDGKPAVFVRKSTTETVDVSQKQGGANDSLGARYETASRDGSHVFFTANYGLTSASSSGPTEDCSKTVFGSVKACDLYDYEVENPVTHGPKLTDLSADTNPADTNGAAVNGVVAVSEDGSSVYFAARGQLVLGEGKTYAQNISGAGSANLYLARGGQLSYVATVAAADMNSSFGSGVLVRTGAWTAETSPDGRHLLFPSRANLTGYDSGGAVEAYLYSDTGAIQCVSCRPDGLPPVGGISPLISSFPAGASLQSQPRKMSDDGSRVFFVKSDALAPGAVSGDRNLYEWERGQIYLLATDATAEGLQFYGASNSGNDVFFVTPQQLDAHDTDFVRDAYDARVGDGFPPPTPPPHVCDVASSQCQGPETPQPAGSNPASQSPSGEGNPPLQTPRCRKGKVRKHGKCVPRKHRRHCRKGKVRKHGKCVPRKHRRQEAQKRSHQRAANTNRGGAK